MCGIQNSFIKKRRRKIIEVVIKLSSNATGLQNESAFDTLFTGEVKINKDSST